MDQQWLEVFALTDKGLVRTRNEDYVYASAEEGLLIVADGMGGHAGGEVASAVAVDAAVRALKSREWPASDRFNEEGPRRLREAILEADRAVRQRARREPALAGMGTTIVVAWCAPRTVIVGHVGDSRAYLFRRGRLIRVTNDHTLVQELVELGRLPPGEAKHHPMRHIITRSLGGYGPATPEIQVLGWDRGDLVLLASDGLTQVVEEEEIQALLAEEGERLHTCARGMVELANRRGGPDNISVVLGRRKSETG